VPEPHVHGKLFDGWLKAARWFSGGTSAVARSDSGAAEDADQGGETWWEREHLAAPPAHWHPPVVAKAKAAKGKTKSKMHKLAAKQEPREEPNQFHGEGADASPETIEEDVRKGLKPFGSGKDPKVATARMPTSIAQKLHRAHRSIAATLHHSTLAGPQ